jgi:HD-GYP domain-containing protein (c-di-GMP phosphodiesterase class II)
MTAQCLEVLQEGTPCSAYRVLFEELAMLAEYRLDATGHVLRVSTYAAALARVLGVDETTAERISVASVVKVADVLDALQSPRTYKPAWTWEQTMAYVSRVSGTELDERVVGVVKRHPNWFRRGVL